jgi:hypothetical protein
LGQWYWVWPRWIFDLNQQADSRSSKLVSYLSVASLIFWLHLNRGSRNDDSRNEKNS